MKHGCCNDKVCTPALPGDLSNFMKRLTDLTMEAESVKFETLTDVVNAIALISLLEQHIREKVMCATGEVAP